MESTPSSKEIQVELERVLGSPPFAHAHRSQRFLRYVVEVTLNDRAEFLKEFAIAVDVFGRNVSYDPSINATVRVEAGRVRSRLREYYTDQGRHDPVIIDVPKGGYRAVFTRRSINPEGDVPQLAPALPADEPPRQSGKPRWLKLLPLAIAAVILVVAMGGIALWKRRTPPAVPAANGASTPVTPRSVPHRDPAKP